MNEIELAGFFFLGGIVVTISGSLFADWRNYRRRRDYMKFQWTYEERIKNYKKILDFLNLHQKIMSYLFEEDKIELEDFEELSQDKLNEFYQLSSGYHFFNSKEVKGLFNEYAKKIKFPSKENDENKICQEFRNIGSKIRIQIEKDIGLNKI